MCCVTATGRLSVDSARKRATQHSDTHIHTHTPCRQLDPDQQQQQRCKKDGLENYVPRLIIINMFPGVFYALLAGFLGAVASSSAKLSLGADYLKGVCETGLRTWGEQRKFRQADETTACDRVRHRRS